MTAPDAATQRDEPYWIVLTPSADDAGWREAIRAGVEAAGLTLRDAAHEVPASTDQPEREVWLTSDCEVVESLGRRPGAVIMPRPATAPDAVTRQFGLVSPVNMSQASILLARAAAQDSRRTQVVTARQIQSNAEAPITLGRGIVVSPPRPEPVEPPRPALLVAMEAFVGGAPTAGQEIVWAEGLFRYDQKAVRGQANVGELDVTGRPRILVYGPYLGLTPGRWRARMRFLVNKSAATKEFRMDWGTPHDFSSLPIVPPHAGVFELDLEHDWIAPEYGELRLWLMEGAFDGILHFLGATVTYMGRAGSD